MDAKSQIQIGKWGNSLGICLPKYALDMLELKSNDS